MAKFPEQRAFVDALAAARNGVAAKPASKGSGPKIDIYSIDFRNLPACVKPATRDLMVEIMGSAGVIDKSETKDSRGSNIIGAMRQVHTNDRLYLPRLSTAQLKNLSGRAKVYDAYVTAHKGHTNDRVGENSSTGYVEYTAGDNQVYPAAHLSEMRIVFDYVNSLIYYTPFHYQGWRLEGNDDLEVLDKPTTGPNPFYWVIEISKKI
jgi:hypothetical protein